MIFYLSKTLVPLQKHTSKSSLLQRIQQTQNLIFSFEHIKLNPPSLVALEFLLYTHRARSKRKLQIQFYE